MHISATEMATFKRCRRLWYYSSLNRQALQPKRPSTALNLGIGVHEALEMYYGQKEDPIAYFKQWAKSEAERLYTMNLNQEDMDDLTAAWELGVGMLQHYVSWATDHDDFEVVAAEQEFMIPIMNPGFSSAVGHFVGRFDGIIRDLKGEYWVIDHKTFSVKPQSADWLQLDEQTTGYTYAATVLAQQGELEKYGCPAGSRIRGCLYNGIRKKLPTIPPLLKSGDLSRAANMDTTYQTYYAAIVDNGLNPKEYRDVLDRLKNKPNTFFSREYRERGIEELMKFEEQLLLLHQEMSNPRAYLYHNPSRDCLWSCDFRQPCIAKNTGGDEGLQLRMLYIPRDSKGQVYEQGFEG